MSRKEVRGLGRVASPGGLGSAPPTWLSSPTLLGAVRGGGRGVGCWGQGKGGSRETSPVAQRATCAPSVGGTGSNPGWGLRLLRATHHGPQSGEAKSGVCQ